MKVLELLVKERIGKSWVNACTEIKQNGVGEILLIKNAVTVKYKGFEGAPIADDWQTAIVTKEQYDNACKLVDDGYTLWFGGECPVQGNTIVDVRLSTGHTQYSTAGDWDWEWKDGMAHIIAYRIKTVDNNVNLYPPSTGFVKDAIQRCLTDVVNHPSHYTNGKVECIDAIEAATVGKTGIEAVCVANVIKYLWRYEDKNGLEDIKKAQWYLNKLIEVKK